MESAELKANVKNTREAESEMVKGYYKMAELHLIINPLLFCVLRAYIYPNVK